MKPGQTPKPQRRRAFQLLPLAVIAWACRYYVMKRKELGQLSSGLKMVHQNVQRRTLCWSKDATAFFSYLCNDGQSDKLKKTSQANLFVPQQLAVDPNQNDFEVVLNATPKSGLNQVVPQRSDSPSDWQTHSDARYRIGEPRILCPTVPPPLYHPTQSPSQFDLVGITGIPTHGPLCNGPCYRRVGSRDGAPWPIARHIQNAFTNYFYSSNYRPK
ncbi:MAG: hypothetical protein HOH16_04260 [Planctomycetaceae bacterium]|nr:hypothetical protein [Planctomycetaceae bacterium]